MSHEHGVNNTSFVIELAAGSITGGQCFFYLMYMIATVENLETHVLWLVLIIVIPDNFDYLEKKEEQFMKIDVKKC